MSEPNPTSRHDPYAALRSANYRRFASGFLFSSAGLQMLGTAIGWEIYERTHDPLMLGYVGLARALPVILLALPAGHAIDHFNRKRVLIVTQFAMGLAAALLALASHLISLGTVPLWTIYILLVLTGCARSFNGPSRASILPMIIEPGDFHNAVTWNSSVFQISATAGPILAGIMIHAFNAAWPVYAVTAAGCFAFALSSCFLNPRHRARPTGPLTLRSMTAGAGHVWREKTILSAITLDLFAVLLGGATALMPVYAKDILRVDAIGLGVLKAAPYVGSFVMALVIAHMPPIRRSGPALLLSVAGFGLATVVFGLSPWFPLSLAALFVAGALDNISVVIRHVLVQVRTPDELRGRVAAVNSVFIESSNEIGGFESGLVARFFGPVFSVVSGGLGTLAVVVAVALIWPEIRKLGSLHEETKVALVK